MYIREADIRPGMRLSRGYKDGRYYVEVEVVNVSSHNDFFNGRVLNTSGEYYIQFVDSICSCSKSALWALVSSPDPDAPD